MKMKMKMKMDQTIGRVKNAPEKGIGFQQSVDDRRRETREFGHQIGLCEHLMAFCFSLVEFSFFRHLAAFKTRGKIKRIGENDREVDVSGRVECFSFE